MSNGQGIWSCSKIFMETIRAQIVMGKLSRKERSVFKLGGASLRNAAAVVFSTDWQRGIFEKAYNLDSGKNVIIENYCGPREPFIEPENRTFVAGTRPLK